MRMNIKMLFFEKLKNKCSCQVRVLQLAYVLSPCCHPNKLLLRCCLLSRFLVIISEILVLNVL